MSHLSWGLFLTTSRNTIKEYRDTELILGVIESVGHPDWGQEGAAWCLKPHLGLQISIPWMEVVFVSECEAAVRKEMALQQTFYGVDALELSKYRDTGFEYMRMLRAALVQMVETLRRNHVRIEGTYKRKLAQASRGFRENAKARTWGRYKGLAGGRKSPLSTVTSVHDPGLIDINDAENAENFSWDEYIHEEYLEARDGVGG
ncbi:hypothetical protein EKO27_g10683 [Xylaria grammica]|uniref:Uncharacterized protein n=1 Tax=Xylaria grammica TaxID=363999 RepID=A0A439CQI0_9PEZI|nr:hypothetical protein EKO27_g10683 [Xylaria grammica]